jgi:hypothetical protein
MVSRKMLLASIVILLAALFSVQKGAARDRGAARLNLLDPDAALGPGFTYQGVLMN